jgi:hypothetical protein
MLNVLFEQVSHWAIMDTYLNEEKI